MLEKISILGGNDKAGAAEPIKWLDVRTGEVLAVVGPTGSGKTQLISDIEQYASGDTPTGRSILVNEQPADKYAESRKIKHLVAEVSQNMNFVIDMSIEEFLLMHARIRSIDNPGKLVEEVLEVSNKLAGEPLSNTDNLTALSGGQSRALMVADVALISNAPIVLIDEIENAGIDRLKALEFLTGNGKVVLVVTHDPTLMLLASNRVVMKNGGMNKYLPTSGSEREILVQLTNIEKEVSLLRNRLRDGETI